MTDEMIIMDMQREELDHWGKQGRDTRDLMIFLNEKCRKEAVLLTEKLAKDYYCACNIKRGFEECFLALEFPDTVNEVHYNKFFDSPEVISRNQVFKGVFVIYLKNQVIKSGEAVEKLYQYMEENQNNIKFIILAASNGETEQEDMLRKRLIHKARMKTYHYPNPTSKELMDYIAGQLSKCGYDMNPQALSYMKDYIQKTNNDKRMTLNYEDMELYAETLLSGRSEDEEKKVITRKNLESCMKVYTITDSLKRVHSPLGF